ncbi:MAG: hypothetical protein FWH24_05800 [Oscillospiraceae bacterium]|nr:hypothetical protein [Oscillospiraceae bacterium]
MDKQTKKQSGGDKKGIIFMVLGILTIMLIIAGIILGYFVSYEGRDGDIRDGLGRLLDEVPDGFSFILRQWAGFIWFFIDCIVIFSLIILTDKLFVKSKLYLTGKKDIDF